MNRIQKVSLYVLRILNALIVGLPLIVILSWLFIDASFLKVLIEKGMLYKPVQTPEGPVLFSAINWNMSTKMIGLGSYIVSNLPILIGIFYLRKIFHHYKSGDFFNIMNCNHYNVLGWLFFFDALVAKPLSECLIILATTFSNPPGHRWIALGFGTPNLEAIFCGALIIIISWIMKEACKIYEEQKLTI